MRIPLAQHPLPLVFFLQKRVNIFPPPTSMALQNRNDNQHAVSYPPSGSQSKQSREENFYSGKILRNYCHLPLKP